MMRGRDGSTVAAPTRPRCLTCGSTSIDAGSPEFAYCNGCGDEWPYDPAWVFPGDRITRWWHTFEDNPNLQELTVVRVNRLTVTVDTDQGSRFRLPVGDVVGFVDWDEDD